MLINLINNIAFLIALAAVGQLVVSRFHNTALKYRLMLGVLFGSVALLGMVNPVKFAPGVFFDGRSIVLSVAGVVGGVLTAAIAGGMAVLYRYLQGGIGAPVGITVILLSALLGVLARRWWQRRSGPPHFGHHFALGVVVQLMQLAAFTQVPDRSGYAFIEQAWWVLLLFYPLATALLCMIFRNYEQLFAERDALQAAQKAVIAEERASMDRFHAYFDHAIVGLAITSVEKGWVEVNDALCQTLGYTRDELTRMTWSELTYPDDLAPDLAQFNRMLAGEIKSYAMDKRFIHKDGRLVHTRLAVSHVRKPDGSPDYLVAMVEDISDRKQSELALENSEKQLRFVLEGSGLGFWDWNIATGEVERNEQWALMLGYTLDEIRHTTQQWTDFIHPDDRERAWDSIKAVIEGRSTAHRLEYRMLQKDGSIRWILDQASVMQRDAYGKPVRMCGTHTDITERKRAEQALRASEQRFRSLFEQVPNIAVQGYDAGRRVIYWNAASEALYGYSSPEAQERQLEDLIIPDSMRQGVIDAVTVWMNGGPAIPAGELDLRRKDGSLVSVFSSHALLINTNGEPEMYCIDVELTELKKKEAELLNYQTHLEKMVEERTVALSIAKQGAESANLAKSAFLANMSHEIRTPLNAITGMAYILRRTGLTPEQADKLDKIETAGSHLLRIINDVLDLSKIEAGKFALEDAPVHIEALLVNIASMLGQKASDKGLRFQIETPALRHNLRGDLTRLQQALLNYASNAIKFTETGHITLRVVEEAQTDKTATLRFEVEDTGIGISPEAQHRLFGAFEQADNSMTRKYGGTGLGLAVTKRIAEVMGGTAGVTSAPSQGSTFWFTAVLRKGQPAAFEPANARLEGAVQAIQCDHAGERILLAEDEPINREIAQTLLEDAGLQVDLAEDGQQAVEKARSAQYAVILMDMQMPVMDGLDATKRIRQLPGHQATPILAMTANAFAENKNQCFAAGMDDFISKPVTADVFYETLLKWLKKRRG